ncbi:hypothetical protein jhhlp_001504 [Lomentospora prolificans]|uniref:HMG box domain-containing protein n=1 Tax=Lomentospora prolificans TaxID=41688 RepID=A0A2N3NIE7_9PEZI|nr:hypothetical protein jhhlp_001504 [Lomentospora prolificans]
MDDLFNRQRSTDEPMAPPAAPGRLTRKRTASINTEQANNARPDADSHVYLAFILYRQHHQAAVTAQHPGLPNPDVSKIIGEQWRNEEGQIKDYWKNLAEEEKKRHQRQYPDYRYTPRRGGRGSGARPSSVSSDDGGRCPRCGGRYIATPRTPSSQFPPTRVPSISYGQAYPTEDGQYYHPPQDSQNWTHQTQLYDYHHNTSLRDIQEEGDSMFAAPGSKRRRYNTSDSPSAGMLHHENTAYAASGPAPSSASVGLANRLYGPSQRPRAVGAAQTTAGPTTVGPQPDGVALPPLRNDPRLNQPLRLPPLHTQLAPSQEANETPVLAFNKGHGTQEEGVAAMVMSVPHMRKMHILSKIAPPYRQRSDIVEDQSTFRGCFIAVEGPIESTLRAVGAAVERALHRCGEISLKTFFDPEPLPLIGRFDPASQDSRARTFANENASLQLDSYIRRILGWRERSEQIVDHITTIPESTVAGEEVMQRSSSDGSIIMNGSMSDGFTAAGIGNGLRKFGSGRQTLRQPTKIPVALANAGFSVTYSDRFSCTIPIEDEYAPTEHWQWMATQWRGIVGPDLFIYAKPTAETDDSLRNTVELRSQNVMLVRTPVGEGLDEKTERRLAFEIIEWVRAGQSQRL